MFTNLSELEQKELQTVINQLLSVNFIVKEKDKSGYYMGKRHKEKLEQFFHFLGWDFVFDDRLEIILVTSPKGLHQRRLTREESIWLLVMRLIYQEKREGLSLSNFPVVTLYEIKRKYEAFKLPELQKTKLREFIRMCSHYQLMQPLDSDWHSDDCRFCLYHSWVYMVKAESIEKVSYKIDRYVTDEMEEQADEMVTEIETR